MTQLPHRPEDMSHAMLIAILMHHGGSMELPAGAFTADALGGLDGSWHAVAMEPQPGGTLRISVRPRPDGDAGGVVTL
nr:pRL2-19 [Streptomyces anulatus]WTE08806.1 pRL2-19 [Streptomyces anulatus]